MDKPDTQDGIVRQYMKDMALPGKKLAGDESDQV